MNQHVMADVADDRLLVVLQPFSHQVGGHTCVLEINKHIICKPSVEKEVAFYRNEPDELKGFTPRYLGETEVFYDAKRSSNCLFASVPRQLAETEDLQVYDESRPLTMATESLSRDCCGQKRKRKRGLSPKKAEIVDGEAESKARLGFPSELDAWSKTCIERQINRYGFWANNQPQKFIMLENLVWDYRLPCLIDIKMGRRQYGDDTSEEKRKLLEERCAFSTSSSLGYRICGSQVYKESEKKYVFHDKYVGRNLDDAGVLCELRYFFHNGIQLRTDAINHIISRLNELKTCLYRHNLLKFSACSLLLIYEGSSVVNNANKTPDAILSSSGSDVSNNDHTCSQENSCSISNSSINTVKTDVRLIDFAHVNTMTEEESTRLKKQGETIIFGLNKLVENLQQLIP